MYHSHVSEHLGTKKHKHCFQALHNLVNNAPVNILAASVKKQSNLLISVNPTSPPDDLYLPWPYSMSLQAEESLNEVDYPLADL